MLQKGSVIHPSFGMGMPAFFGGQVKHSYLLVFLFSLFTRPDDLHARTNVTFTPISKAIVKTQGKSGASCSGVLIGPKVVLTAAHCAMSDNASLGAKVYFLARGRKRCAETEVTKVSFPPGIFIHRYQNHEYPFPDVALLKLKKKPCGAQPVSLNFAGLSRGETVYSAGFGTGNQNPWRPEELKFRSLEQSVRAVLNELGAGRRRIPADVLRMRQLEVEHSFLTVPTDGHSVCAGDSGGPVYKKNREQVQLIGVVSTVIVHRRLGDPRCDMGFVNIFSKVAIHKKWINKVVKKWR